MTTQPDLPRVQRLLSRKDHPTVALHGSVVRITAAEVLLMLERGEYTFRIRKGRVRHMRAVERTVVCEWRECYRNSVAPVLQPSIEWLNSRRAA